MFFEAPTIFEIWEYHAFWILLPMVYIWTTITAWYKNSTILLTFFITTYPPTMHAPQRCAWCVFHKNLHVIVWCVIVATILVWICKIIIIIILYNSPNSHLTKVTRKFETLFFNEQLVCLKFTSLVESLPQAQRCFDTLVHVLYGF